MQTKIQDYRKLEHFQWLQSQETDNNMFMEDFIVQIKNLDGIKFNSNK